MKLRVLQILPELNVGGVETGTVDMAKYLLQHGHYPVVVSSGGPLVRDLEASGIRHYALPVQKKSIRPALRAVKDLRRIIIEERIDIVHARSRVPAWIAFFACRGTKAEFITTCHGYYSVHWFSRVMGWGKLAIVPSDVIGRHMIDDFGVPADHIRSIPRSVDLERFSVPRDQARTKTDFRIAIVGRITPLKGHVYFLKAMAKVVRIMPYVKIWIIGDAPPSKESYRLELEALVRRLGLEDVVEFLGSRKDVPQLLAQTDVLVLASVVPEAFGRVIIEAQAEGVPVVATQVGGVVEIIDHEKTGLLVMPKDPEDIAQAVIRLLQDRALAQEIAVQARKKLLAHYTLEHMAQKTIQVYRELLKMMSILVIKLSAVGDVVLVTASLKAIRQRYPHAKITCLVGEEARKILQRCPYVDELIIVDAKGRDKGLWAALRQGRKLAQKKFDKVIDFQNNRLSHVLAFLAFAPETCGYNNGKWGFLLNRPVRDPDHSLPPVAHQFQILRILDIAYPQDARLELWPSERDHRHVRELLDAEWLGDAQKIVGINLSASPRWKTKNWPLEHIARLCDILAGQNIRVLLTGVAGDAEAVQALLGLVKSKPANLVGKTDIMELAALISQCRVFVTPDSAPMHIASAVGTPFVAFFGPTAAYRHLPPAQAHVVMQKNLPCVPCYNGTACRIQTHACMKDITPDEVAQQVFRLVNDGL